MPTPDDPLERLLDPERLRADHLELVLWKLVRVTGVPLSLAGEALAQFDEHEVDTLWEIRQMPCPTCSGTGQDGTRLDGQPRPCTTCDGKGRR